MADKVITSTGDCSDCCGGGTTCPCALLIPPFDSPYADYATAESVVDPASLTVADCMAYYGGTAPDSAFDATFDGTTLTATGTWTGTSGIFGPVWVSVAGLSGATFTLSHTAGAVIGALIYDCGGTLIETISPVAGPITSSALSADGEYYIKATVSNPPGPGTPFSSCSISITSSDTFTVNPVIAKWDDGGTTRNLWACPKLLLPPLTESTGDWYADCAAAASDITDYVSNCVGYITSIVGTTTFTATDGGTSLTLDADRTFGFGESPLLEMWGGINLVDGDVLTVTQSISGTGGSGTAATASLYDDTGTLVETESNITGSNLVFSAAPYTGRYSLYVSGAQESVPLSGDVSATFVATSSGTMSVNPIQALYDTGLTCPGRLDCGDSCP